MKRGGNQYLDMTLKTEEWTLDEAKIQEAERFDGYYAIIANNLTMIQFRASTKLDLNINLK